MKGVLVDSNIILDFFLDDPVCADWSERKLDELSQDYELLINPIIYTEVSIGFDRIEDLEKAIAGCGFIMVQLPREALFLAGKAFMQYRKREGRKRSPLPGFFIGAHAAVSGISLVTRDIKRYKTYFPKIDIIHP